MVEGPGNVLQGSLFEKVTSWFSENTHKVNKSVAILIKKKIEDTNYQYKE